MKILFRVDATDEIGAGHFMRCLNLADALKPFSAKICFISRNLPFHLQTLLESKCYDFLSLNSGDNSLLTDDLQHSRWLGVTQELDALDTIRLAENGWDWLVVDHYGIDHRWETKLRGSAKRILAIDDLADRKHDCDFLLDQNLFSDLGGRYENKVPSNCVLLLGPTFVLMREEFVKLRRHVNARNGKIKRVLVFFGSIDRDNLTAHAIHTLININIPNLEVDVVVGIQHPYLLQIKSLCIDHNFTCHVQTQQMAELMFAADFAIGAGGISTYERLYLRLPAILTPVSLNQIEPLKYMSGLGLFELFFNLTELEAKLKRILQGENFSPPDCVENGSNKIVNLMLNEFASLTVPSPLDIRRTFTWLQNKQLRDDFVMSSSPCRSEHFKFWRKSICDSDQRVFSVNYFDRHVGNCGLKNINSENRSCELWVYLADITVRRRGLADSVVKMLLAKAKNELFCTKIYLHVVKTNIPAISLYKKNGFNQIEKLLESRWAGRDGDIIYMEHML